MNFARLGSFIQSRLNRLTSRPVTVGGLIGATVTLTVFSVATLYPAWETATAAGMIRPGWWALLRGACIPFACALYLKYSDSFTVRRGLSKRQRNRRNSRQITTGHALRDLCAKLRDGKRDDEQMRPIREAILEAAALSVAEMLVLPAGQKVTANLLEFTDETLTHMQVMSRSAKERRTPGVPKPRDTLIAFQAITAGRPIMVDDVQADSHWAGQDDPPYRAVLAIPVGFDGVACAAMTIDHEDPYTFYERTADLAVQLEPYAATLALTYHDRAHYHSCTYEPRR